MHHGGHATNQSKKNCASNMLPPYFLSDTFEDDPIEPIPKLRLIENFMVLCKFCILGIIYEYAYSWTLLYCGNFRLRGLMNSRLKSRRAMFMRKDPYNIIYSDKTHHSQRQL